MARNNPAHTVAPNGGSDQTSVIKQEQQSQWIQNPYLNYPAIYNAGPQVIYPRSGVVGPLDYYQLQPQLAAMMSAAGFNARELCVVCGDKVNYIEILIVIFRFSIMKN